MRTVRVGKGAFFTRRAHAVRQCDFGPTAWARFALPTLRFAPYPRPSGAVAAASQARVSSATSGDSASRTSA